MRLRVVLVVVVALAAGCREEEPDFRQRLRDLTTDLRGKVEPLPRVRETEDAAYRGAKFPDPFYPAAKRSR